MGGGRKGIERHHDLPTGGSGALPEVAAVLADAALIGEAAPPPRLDVLVWRRPTTLSLASSLSEPAPAEVEEVVGLGPRIANAFVPRRKPPMPPRPTPTGGGGGGAPLQRRWCMFPPWRLRVTPRC